MEDDADLTDSSTKHMHTQDLPARPSVDPASAPGANGGSDRPPPVASRRVLLAWGVGTTARSWLLSITTARSSTAARLDSIQFDSIDRSIGPI